ncbi:family 20 glycosylhydrolase [Flavobacterium johnsoniae]|uniref:beta-N-acetylhexosaminidase n=1 Tax=Flavobacterium johnsoniae (strain ATCC 17061 / DSM 2064 / JCM 8514 / BCRC 14874 / CCUG 350202 / NBRC 14942 / NCIMB 11054 / UW101) TaxID=376686 RepID=A5FM67_FLAJ1|nr:family 20 glycosylhydrolase [Flavobacterium johnsoniae]ABQ03709.1 Candidate beta-N-acetylglucosaminidase; Glycoside hydrolase family 20 [Flavobacterium johnsoniae UW101]OXG03232.1 beta-N-acetylhexosaminidase [Flavobacterium johnsoniae UW101]WQG79429.1 family 20 glycosylhydrolase [Flavobacterium johnsoniae UW101]SHK00385.1 hexosaminidase [Flavobacterium johnsoniae]
MQKSIFLLLIFCFSFGNAQSTCDNTLIIPAPNFYKTNGDSIRINGKIKIAFDKNTYSAKELKTAQIFESAVNANTPNKKSNIEVLFIAEKPSPASKKEGYKINISSKKITVTGSEEGLFYAVQSLLQLLPNQPKNQEIKLPFATIEDEPRYDYRGLHLDVCRHFFSVNVIKDFIAQMSYYKLNNFHWHLTDDQGWRIEIKKYPKLTEVGSKRAQTLVGNKFERFPYFFDGNPYGGFYTQEEIKDVVKFAEDHYVNIIPEIEMPGHATAAVTAYPNLSCFPDRNYKVVESWGVFEDIFCAGKEETFTFLEDVLTEVMALFPSKYIHIGGDECPKARWKECPNCQKRIAALGLKDEHELQSYLTTRIEKFLNANGRQILGWDEMLEGGLAPNAAVMSWRGESGGISAAKQKHFVIMNPEQVLYLDYNQGYSPQEPLTIGRLTTVEKIYNYNPTPVDSLTVEEQKYIMGVQSNLWSEYLTTPAKLNYMIYPRVFALAEIAWTEPKNKNYNRFILNQIPHHLEKLEAQKRMYKVPIPFGSEETALIASSYILDLKPTIKNGQIFYTIDGYNPDETAELYTKPVTIHIPKGEFRIIKTVQISPGGRKSSISKILVRNPDLKPTLALKPTKKGLKFDYYTGTFQQVQDLELTKPVNSGIFEGKISAEKWKTKLERYIGLKFDGYIFIPETANYTISTLSDDGSKLFIDNELVVNNDGIHWLNEAYGVIKLEKGFHKINISYFDQVGGTTLTCFIQQEGKEKQEISESQLYYE